MEEVQNITPTVKRLRDSCLSYIARSAAVSEHRHYCYKIAVSLDNSVNCWIRQSPHIAIKGFIVNQRQVHKCASPEGPVLSTLIEPESTWGKKIKVLLGDRDFVEFEEILDPATISDIVPSDYAELSNESLGHHIEHLVCQLTGTHPDDVSAVDERIEELVRFISKNLTQKITRDDLSDITFLSYERTRHLFVEEMGIPLSRYILWQKLRRALDEIINERRTFSEVSIRYGFVDQSHFNRMFKRVFGFSPSTFLLECRVII